MRPLGLRKTEAVDAQLIDWIIIGAARLSLFSFSIGYILLTGLLTLPSGPYTCDIASALELTQLLLCMRIYSRGSNGKKILKYSTTKESIWSIRIRKSHDTSSARKRKSYSQNRRPSLGALPRNRCRSYFRWKLECSNRELMCKGQGEMHVALVEVI